MSSTDDATRELAHDADTDGDGSISKAEWLAAVKTAAIKQLANMTQLQANRTFAMVDHDENGKLSVQEFANAFKGDDEWANHMNPDQDVDVHKFEAQENEPVTHGMNAATPTSAAQARLMEEKQLEEDLQSNGVYWYSHKKSVPAAETQDVPQATQALVESIAPPELTLVEDADNSLYAQQSRLFDQMFNVSSPELKELERDSKKVQIPSAETKLIQDEPKSLSEERSQLLDQMFNVSSADLALIKH